MGLGMDKIMENECIRLERVLLQKAQLSMKLISMNASLSPDNKCTSGSFAWEDHCIIIYIRQLEDDEVSEEFQ
jgi:hypothetical protein